MQHLDDTPRMPKLPFIIGDALLLLTAAFIASQSESPLGTGPLLAISICVGLGAILAVIPFLVDYARRQDDALEERQHRLSTLSREISSTAEQISIAAASIPLLAQHAAQAGKLADQLPKLIQDKIHQLKEALAETTDSEIENLRQELSTLRSAETDKLGEVADKIDQTAARLDQLLIRWEQLPAQTEAAARELQSTLKAATKNKPATAKKADPTPTPAAPAPASEEIVTEPAAPIETVDTTEEPPAPAPIEVSQPEPDTQPISDEPASEPEPLPEPKPAPRRKAPPPIDDNPDLFESNATDDEPSEETTARSADGATRLIVTAYIGIGNKLYIRGEGPGLNPDHGIPLQFVSIGKWRWETESAETPVKVRLYKNDQIACTSLGEVTLKPAHQHEVSASF